MESTKTTIHKILSSNKVFSNITEKSLQKIEDESTLVMVEQGQTVLRANTIEESAFIIVDGSLRLLAEDSFKKELYTVGKAQEGEIIGLVDLLRQESCEIAIATRQSRLLSIPLKLLYEIIQIDNIFAGNATKITSICEAAYILERIAKRYMKPPKNTQKWIKENIIANNEAVNKKRLLSTRLDDNEDLIGKEISNQKIIELEMISKLPIRFWYGDVDAQTEPTKKNENDYENENAYKNVEEKGEKKKDQLKNWKPVAKLDLEELGLKEGNSNSELNMFRIIKGSGNVKANLAMLRMIARAYNTPCAVDVLENILEGADKRSKSVSIQAMGQLIESMGLQTQVGSVKLGKISQLELPIVIAKKGTYVLVTEIKNKMITMANPEEGWKTISYVKASEEWGEELPVITIKKLVDTPQKQFGWSWFSPVINRFRWPLVQVLLASLFIQLFQLANPLLLQQIIDKVISQSNLSALQVLGSALVAAALVQGVLTAVRTWLLIDTSDRMDLILGTQVIDKLLRLPLRFFEKRPVGELSQRLSELSNLRSFLTGTAITSLLDILFAIIYIFIMVLYSPILTVVALSTIPIYITMILLIAPVYRSLIRSQAQYSAKTQSHLIETLSGIQTVKAQHFELNSRWKWQERYSGQIAEGFKSVILGTTAGEVGNFLNQLSSLLIIWVGVYLVVEGKLSLGQLIAFRIIAGYVTGPILRLSSLWQGFQQVSISMERLSDIVDQVAESGDGEIQQIALPAIHGKVRFNELRFKFDTKGNGPNQIDGIELEIEAGSFVGIVGQSGSGKSTLMKLLPRLYEPQEGRILIDDYDISKVTLNSVRQQVGIVPQDCLLFEGTIRENIAMNNPEASTDEILRVAKAAEAHGFIMELADGYSTKLGERGAGLSGGQQQRIAIARTILQNPNLLVLDEATSALDYETESSVCANLQRELQNKTVFFITHRLSTVRNADMIVVMHEGKIAEMGTHKELISLNQRYARLYKIQGDV